MRSRLFQVADRWWHGPTRPANTLPTEVTARLDVEGGLAKYRRDDVWQRGVERHFQNALTRMVRDAQDAGVRVVIVDPVCNVTDCPPFKSESVEQLDLTAPADESATARIKWLEAITREHPRCAGTWYMLGREYLAAGRDDEARVALLRAKDEDLCPLRLTEPLRRITHDVAAAARVPIVPAFAVFCERSPHGLPGDEWLLDHVHPTITGQQRIAELLLEELEHECIVSRPPDWLAARDRLYQAHLATIDAPYYARGQEHLDGLRRWARGRLQQQSSRP